MSDEDFCLLHGRNHMRSDQGPIPYCAICDLQPPAVLDAIADQVLAFRRKPSSDAGKARDKQRRKMEKASG